MTLEGHTGSLAFEISGNVRFKIRDEEERNRTVAQEMTLFFIDEV
jgi:hypothetical protein